MVNQKQGTNNIAQRHPTQIAEAIQKIVQFIRATLGPQTNIVLFGILPRKDVAQPKIDALNGLLEQFVNDAKDEKLTYQYFGDVLSLGVDYDDHVHLNKFGYVTLFALKCFCLTKNQVQEMVRLLAALTK